MRLKVSVLLAEYAQLLDRSVAPPRQDRAAPYTFAPEEVWTPKGLPLRFEVTLGTREELAIYTSDTLLFQTFGLDNHFDMQAVAVDGRNDRGHPPRRVDRKPMPAPHLSTLEYLAQIPSPM